MESAKGARITAIEHYESAECSYFTSGRCSSCSLLAEPSGERIATKLSRLRTTLSSYGITPLVCEDLVIPKHPWGTRHKIKMSVAGTIQFPTIGLAHADGQTQDLSDCPLMPPKIRSLVWALKRNIEGARIPPYDIASKRGELKGIIVLMNRAGSEGILRYILRSSEAIPRIRKALPNLIEHHPWLRVVSCNIQPLHAAIPEGPEEVLLTTQHSIEELHAGVPLAFTPRSFMQVTPEIAEALYQRAAEYVAPLAVHSALDLFCGVGGFSFAIAPFVERVQGVEISPHAIESAVGTAKKLGYSHMRFCASDVDHYLSLNMREKPELVLVNPPRRGLSTTLKAWLTATPPAHLIYSSCNPETFARDVSELTGSYSLTTIAPFEMFPLTSHIEVLGFFSRNSYSHSV